jgi:DNA-binding transcriptional LysR family regulator
MEDFDRLFSISGLSLERLRTFLAVSDAGNIARAADGDPVRQSQFSRQIKELEAFFGVALTRRVGRRIEITSEGFRLASLVRQQFKDLSAFRSTALGDPVVLRLGAAGSVLDWVVVPKLGEVQPILGEVLLELHQGKTAEIVRRVADGGLDFGIVRESAIAKGMKHHKLGRTGYALFAPKRAWRSDSDIGRVISNHPMAELYPGSEFQERYRLFLEEKGWTPRVIARVGSFVQLARLVKASGVAAVLPQLAMAEFDPSQVISRSLPWQHERALVLIANSRGLDRAGLDAKTTTAISKLLAWDDFHHREQQSPGRRGGQLGTQKDSARKQGKSSGKGG